MQRASRFVLCLLLDSFLLSLPKSVPAATMKVGLAASIAGSSQLPGGRRDALRCRRTSAGRRPAWGMDKAVEPGYGFTGWDSYDNTLSGEIAMAPCLTMKPVIGILKSNYVAIANKAPHPNAAKLFINVFPSAMYDPEFQGAALVSLAQAQGLTPDRVVLEITENAAIENYDLFADALAELTRFGFSIAVDDVGAGYSGLEKIANLYPRYLKFDIELIRNIDSSYIRREMTRALKSFADSIGSTIIAEGIERSGELKTLLDLGIQYGQGYLLGRPDPAFQTPALAAPVAALA